MRARICRPRQLGVQYGCCRRQHVVGDMMVADDEVYAPLTGVCHLVRGLDAAVEDDEEAHSLFGRHVYGGARYAIAVLGARRDIVVDVGVVVSQVLVDQSDGGGAVHVIVSVDHYSLLRPHCPVESGDGAVHVGHQERIVEIAQRGVKEVFSLLDCRYATCRKQLANRRDSRIARGQTGFRFLL